MVEGGGRGKFSFLFSSLFHTRGRENKVCSSASLRWSSAAGQQTRWGRMSEEATDLKIASETDAPGKETAVSMNGATM